MPRIGLISDTHGFLDPKVARHLVGVDHILHAGDIGGAGLVRELERVAPVTAVSGNTDAGLPFRETENVVVAGRKFLVHHIVNPRRLPERLARRIAGERPEVVVFGHTHEPFREVIDGLLFVNPGSVGRPRFGKPRTLAVLHWADSEAAIQVDFIELGP